MSTAGTDLQATSFGQLPRSIDTGQEATSLARDIAVVASISSALDGLGIPCTECRDHFYTLIANYSRHVDAEYTENTAVLASMKKRDAAHLVDAWGEEHFAAALEYLASDTCDVEMLREMFEDMLEALEFSREAAEELRGRAARAGCRELRGLILTALIVPPRG